MTQETDGDMLTGQNAADALVDEWNKIGQGMVDMELIDPWLLVRRAGGDYTMFISTVDDTAVMLRDPDATTRDVPKDLRPDTGIPDDREIALEMAFANHAGGAYPLSDDGVFSMNYTDDDGERHELHIGMASDEFGIVEA